MRQVKLSKRQLAGKWNVDERTIARYVRSGMPHDGSRTTLRFNLAACERWRDGNIVRRMPKLPVRSAPLSPWDLMQAAPVDPVLVCEGCNCLYRESLSTVFGPFDDSHRFCSESCRDAVGQGRTTEEIRAEILKDLLEGCDGAQERREVMADLRAGTVFDHVTPDLGGLSFATKQEIAAARRKS